MSRPDKLQVALFGGGLLLVWAGVQLAWPWLVAGGVAAIGGGFAADGYHMLLEAGTPAADPRWEPTRSQKIVASVRGLLQVALGLALILGSATAAVVGTEGLWRLLTGQPGPLLLGAGAVLIGSSIEVALGEGQPMRSRWELLASLPLRLASLPMLVLGLASLAVGAFALFLPGAFHAWIGATFAPFIATP